MAQSGGANDGAGDSVGDGGGPLVPAVTGAGTAADGGQPTASFWDVFKATVNSPKQEYRESLITFVRQPCFRESMSWGLGVGSLFAIHRFKQDSQAGLPRPARILRASNSLLTTVTLVSVGCWMLCRREEIQKGLAMREFYRRKQSGDDLFDDDEGDGTAVRVLGDSDGDSTAGDTRRSAA